MVSDRQLTGNGESNASSRLHWSADQWLRETFACWMSTKRPPPSKRLTALMSRAGSPEINFHLAEALYRADNVDGALNAITRPSKPTTTILRPGRKWADPRGQRRTGIGTRGVFNRPHRACRLSQTHTGTSPTSWCNSDGPRNRPAHWRKYLDPTAAAPGPNQPPTAQSDGRSAGPLHRIQSYSKMWVALAARPPVSKRCRSVGPTGGQAASAGLRR